MTTRRRALPGSLPIYFGNHRLPHFKAESNVGRLPTPDTGECRLSVPAGRASFQHEEMVSIPGICHGNDKAYSG